MLTLWWKVSGCTLNELVINDGPLEHPTVPHVDLIGPGGGNEKGKGKGAEEGTHRSLLWVFTLHDSQP